MKCCHCGTSNAPHRWRPAICADGNKKRSKWLCTSCDNTLNRFVLEFFNDPKAVEKMAAYMEGQE